MVCSTGISISELTGNSCAIYSLHDLLYVINVVVIFVVLCFPLFFLHLSMLFDVYLVFKHIYPLVGFHGYINIIQMVLLYFKVRKYTLFTGE